MTEEELQGLNNREGHKEIEITLATPEDQAGIVDVQYQAALVAYPNAEIGITPEDIEEDYREARTEESIKKEEDAWRERPPDPDNKFFVAKSEGRVVGFCTVHRYEEKNQLNGIYILPEFQGSGLGKEFWSKAQEFFDPEKDTAVMVLPYNERAKGYYKSLGFEETGRLANDGGGVKMKVSGAIMPVPVEMLRRSAASRFGDVDEVSAEKGPKSMTETETLAFLKERDLESLQEWQPGQPLLYVMERGTNNEAKKIIQYPKIAEEILRRVEADQDMRSRDLEDDSAWDENVDKENTEAMKRIVAEIGWPTNSRVGREAANAAWLLVQHADHDPEFQQACIDRMKSEPRNEVELRDVAYLEDRIRVNTKREQVYGTQFHETRDEETGQKVVSYGPRPIEDFEHVDERRAAMGLEPFEEYRKEITGLYYPHLLDKESE